MKNDYIVHDDRIEIFLIRKCDGLKMSTFVSKRHLSRLLALNNKWYPKWDRTAKYFYVYSRMRNRAEGNSFFLHRWVLTAEKGLVVDHINHDTLNNMDDNLREVTYSQNMQNRNIKRRNARKYA